MSCFNAGELETDANTQRFASAKLVKKERQDRLQRVDRPSGIARRLPLDLPVLSNLSAHEVEFRPIIAGSFDSDFRGFAIQNGKESINSPQRLMNEARLVGCTTGMCA